MMKKYAKHVSLAQACMQKFDAKQLKLLGELEQDMATGLTDDGDKVLDYACTRMLSWLGFT